MAWHRVKSVILYSYYHFTHSMETWIDLFWFSIIQLIVYAFLGTFFEGSETTIGLSLSQIILVGFVFWEVVRITQYSITLGVMWDVWSRSFSTLFVTPLTMSEFLIGQAITGFFKTVAVTFLLALILLLFNLNLFSLGVVGLLAWVPLLVFSWAIGLLVVSLVIRYGTNIQSLAWGLIYIFQPLSAVLYPLEALPKSVQWLALLSPITLVMENVRAQMSGLPVNWLQMGTSTLMAIGYLSVTILLFTRTLRWSKQHGQFARLDA